MDRRTRDAYDRRLPIPRILTGTLIRLVSAFTSTLRWGTGADGVSRRRCALRWFRHCLGERFLLVEKAEFAAPPLTPLSRCNRRKPFDKEGSLESQRQDRLTTRGVNRNVTTPARGAFTR